MHAQLRHQGLELQALVDWLHQQHQDHFLCQQQRLGCLHQLRLPVEPEQPALVSLQRMPDVPGLQHLELCKVLVPLPSVECRHR